MQPAGCFDSFMDSLWGLHGEGNNIYSLRFLNPFGPLQGWADGTKETANLLFHAFQGGAEGGEFMYEGGFSALLGGRDNWTKGFLNKCVFTYDVI